MNFGIKKLILMLIASTVLIGIFGKNLVYGDSSCTTSIQECIDQKISDCSDCATYLQGKVSEKQSEANTLQSQINTMNNEINLTQARIEATQEQITNLTLDIDTASKKIDKLQASLNNLVNVLLNRIVATYEVGTIQPLQILLTSGNAADFITRLNYLRLAQAHDKKLIYDTQQAKVDYTNQKNILQDEKTKVEVLQKQLQVYTAQLAQQKQAKQQILTETQGSEATYQQLVLEAKAELAGFSNFVDAAGASFATFGTGSNGWYYTQRDPQWGGMILPGSSSSVLLAGCAVTSVAMVCKSYGQNFTPASITSNPSKFNYGDLWNWAFECDGKTTDWIGASQDQVRSYVNNGTPVILRLISPSVSGLHFVVAWKWDGSDFVIHDPYYGPDKRFSDRYSWSQVTTAIVIH